jgi:tetratricopeptide (TPR) repeat protein
VSTPSRVATLYTVAAIAVLGTMSFGLQVLRDRRYPPSASEEETLYLKERATGRIVFTHRSLASDLYWIRAIQYYGSRSRQAKAASLPLAPPPALSADRPVSFDLLYPLLDIVTTLDPRFNIAYRFGAIFLSEEGRTDDAVALLQKGLATSPDRWEYWEDIGFVYYWSKHDFTRAAEAFRRGADIPGSPWWLRSMAATTLVKGGDRTTSRLLWGQLLQTANSEYARNAARTKLKQLDAIEIIEQLQKLVDAFGARRGAPATSWNDLVAARAIRGVPLDPADVPYELQPSSQVTVSRESPLFPLPFEPAARAGQ